MWPSASFHEHGFALASRTRDFESIKPSEGNVFGRVCAFSILVPECGFTITIVEVLFRFFICHCLSSVTRNQQVIGCPSNLLRQIGWTTNDLLVA